MHSIVEEHRCCRIEPQPAVPRCSYRGKPAVILLDKKNIMIILEKVCFMLLGCIIKLRLLLFAYVLRILKPVRVAGPGWSRRRCLEEQRAAEAAALAIYIILVISKMFFIV